MLTTVLLTLVLALTTLLIVVPLGMALGASLAHRRTALALGLEVVLLMPLVLPPSAVGLVLLLLLRPSAYLGQLLALANVSVLFTWKAVVLAAVVMSLPFMVRGARSAFEAVDTKLVDMARALGDSPWRAFVRVSLPLASRPLIAAALLAFARALGEFGATMLVAGSIPGETRTLALAIYQDIQVGNDERALAFAGFSTLFALLAVLGAELVNKRRA